MLSYLARDFSTLKLKMSLTINPLYKHKQCTVYNPINYQVTVTDYFPPYQYDLLFEWRLSTNGEKYNIIQNYSISTIVCFTTLKPGNFYLKCSAKLAKQRLYQKIPYLPKQPIHELDVSNVLFEKVIEITVNNINSQQPPCCIPLQGCTAPVYIVPSTKYMDDIQVRVLFKLQEKQKTKDLKLKLDEPAAPTKIDFSKTRKQKINFINNQIQVTGWHHISQQSSTGESGEIYLQLLGMAGGEIYQTKHQLICDGKKLELKNMVAFQANELQSQAQINVIYATELYERPYLIIVDSSISGQLLTQSQELKKGNTFESVLLSPYGYQYLRYNDIQEKNQEQQNIIHQKRRIMITNGAQVVCLCTGQCDFIRPYAYTPVESQQSVKQICQSIVKTLDQAPQSQLTFQNQIISISTLSGVPLRSISVGYVNQQLYVFWENQWKKFVIQQEELGINMSEKLKQPMSYHEIQQLPQYRPLVRLNTFVPLPNGNYLITGQAEVMLIDHPEIYTIVADSVAKSTSKQYKSIDLRVTSILTATIVIVQSDGTIVDYLYVSDILPTIMNTVELVELYLNSEKGQGNIPGFLSQSGYAVNYSFIDQVDVSNSDCFCVLPRQGVILRIDIDNLKQQKLQMQELNPILDKSASTMNLEEAKRDLIMYCSGGACSSLSLLSQKIIQPNMHPLSISRLATHSFVLVNNQWCNSVDVLILRNPQYIGRGKPAINNQNESKDNCTSFDDLTDNGCEYELNRSSLSGSGKMSKGDSAEYLVTDASESEQLDEFLLLERIILQENSQVKSGNIFSIQQRHFVVALQMDKNWHVMEIKQGTCIYASVVSNAESLRFIKVP